MNSNNDDDKIYTLYESAVECSDVYLQLLAQCKANDTLNQNWQKLEDVHTNFSNIIENLIQLEENDLFFTNLIYIRQQFFNHLTILNANKYQFTINDITITKLPIVSNISSEKRQKLCLQGINIDEPFAKKTKTTLKHNNKETLKNVIKGTIITPRSKGLCDVAGLEEEKNILKEVVVFPLQYPHLFRGCRKQWTKALLYGPPGTGKTQLIHSLAVEVKAQLYAVSNADLLSHWVGESEKLIRTLFQQCIHSEQHSIIFFDEVDSFCRRRTSNEEDHTRRIKNELLTQLSELDNLPDNNKKVFFLAATNCPWDLDPAFIRRFHKRIYIPLPNKLTRFEILKLYIKDIQMYMPPNKLKEILDRTDGFSGSDISDLANSAAYQPIKELENTVYWTTTTDSKFMPSNVTNPTAFKSSLNLIPAQKIAVRDITVDDFHIALLRVTKTVSNADIQKYEEFNKSYGSVRI